MAASAAQSSKGLCKVKKIQKIRVYYGGGGWVQVSLGIFVCGKSSQNSPKPVLIFWSSIPYVCILFIHFKKLLVIII